jgi:ABC-2 type transport system permease protein
VARTFVRLKLRLVRNSLSIGQAGVLFVLGAVGATLLAFVGFTALASARGDRTGPDLAVVLFGLTTVGWTFFPILGFGNDETLDPQRLATIPLTRRQLVAGVLVASLVGTAPLATLVAFSGAFVGLAHDLTSTLLIAVVVVVNLLLCVVASRTLVAVLVPVLRSRRGRDFTILAVTILGVLPPVLQLFAAGGHKHGTGRDWGRTTSQIARRVRFTPFAWGGSAIADAGGGHILAGIGFVVAMAALIAVLLMLWSRALERGLTTSDAPMPTSRRGASSAGLIPRAVAFLPHNRVGATAAKELRYSLRDPRRRAPLIGALVIPAVALWASLSQSPDRPQALTLLALVAVMPAAGLTLNQFGLDGAAMWATLVAGNDPRSDLTGKNIASVFVMVPLAVVATFVCALFTHGWSYVPITLGLAPAMFGVLLGVGNVMSVRVPYAMPDRRNPLAFNPGQGCATLLAGLAALAFEGILLIPVAAVTAIALQTQSLPVATILAVVFANAYGASVWLVGRRIAWRDSWWRLPDILEAVSPRQAG